jgi:branched-chain amino acid transport system substrate-binding protein
MNCTRDRHKKMRCLSLFCLLCVIVAASALPPYSDFSDEGAGFYGTTPAGDTSDTLSGVRIGMLGPESGSAGSHLRNGAALAITEANAEGGFRGERPLTVVMRSDEGPWGVAAKQVVKLTYEDGVCAIIGSLDGHRAHLAELITAKAWIPYITPAAADLSIDYANVPWVFRCMPDDGSQAERLTDYAGDQGFLRAVAITGGIRESRVGWRRLQHAVARSPVQWVLHAEYDPNHPAAVVPGVLRHVDVDPCDVFFVWGYPDEVRTIVRRLRDGGNWAPVLLPSLCSTPEFASSAVGLGRIVVAAPFDLSRKDSTHSSFSRRYGAAYGTVPSPVAAYSYDAARMLVKAVREAGADRAGIRRCLATMTHQGVTGEMSFNGLGGNESTPVLMSLVDGQWIRVEELSERARRPGNINRRPP